MSTSVCVYVCVCANEHACVYPCVCTRPLLGRPSAASWGAGHFLTSLSVDTVQGMRCGRRLPRVSREGRGSHSFPGPGRAGSWLLPGAWWSCMGGGGSDGASSSDRGLPAATSTMEPPPFSPRSGRLRGAPDVHSSPGCGSHVLPVTQDPGPKCRVALRASLLALQAESSGSLCACFLSCAGIWGTEPDVTVPARGEDPSFVLREHGLGILFSGKAVHFRGPPFLVSVWGSASVLKGPRERQRWGVSGLLGSGRWEQKPRHGPPRVKCDVHPREQGQETSGDSASTREGQGPRETLSRRDPLPGPEP